MIANSFLHRKLKNIGWDNREKWLGENPNQKLLSTYKVNAAMSKPKDWLAIARGCSENPNHEHYQKEPEEIIEIWQTKKNTGADRGNTLDDYIKDRLSGQGTNKDGYDAELIQKAEQFDGLYDRFISRLPTYVGSEIWLTSYKLGLCVRLDSLFTTTKGTDKNVLICEWKNTERITTKDYFEKLVGVASHLDNCDWVKYTIQIHIYRYILEEYGIFNGVSAYIYQFSTQNDLVKIYKPMFDYDPKFIEDVVLQTKQLIQHEQSEQS